MHWTTDFKNVLNSVLNSVLNVVIIVLYKKTLVIFTTYDYNIYIFVIHFIVELENSQM